MTLSNDYELRYYFPHSHSEALFLQLVLRYTFLKPFVNETLAFFFLSTILTWYQSNDQHMAFDRRFHERTMHSIHVLHGSNSVMGWLGL